MQTGKFLSLNLNTSTVLKQFRLIIFHHNDEFPNLQMQREGAEISQAGLYKQMILEFQQ